MARIGIFGGTFDPPHLGHLVLAESALDQLGLDRVLWVVAGQSPLKPAGPASPVDMRLQLVQAAIASQPRFRPQPRRRGSAGAALLGRHRRDHRRENPGAELYFIMGEDLCATCPAGGGPET